MTPPTSSVRLRKPLAELLREGHPWVYRDALEAHSAEPGSVLTVTDTAGRFVARGLAEQGPIAARLFTARDEVLDEGLLDARLARAEQLRRRVVTGDTNAYRLVHGEGDRLPGFVVDLYGTYAVLRTDGEAAHRWHARFAERLRPHLEARGASALLYRSPASRALRGTDSPRAELLWGEAPAGLVTAREHGMLLRADLLYGQKTGLFLDQRESRLRVRTLAKGLRALNLYAYTGGFSVAAGLGGAASVCTVDIAPAAVELARESWRANGLEEATHRAEAADVPAFLAAASRARERFDLIVADPPSFAPREDAVPQALQSYRALHAACLALLSPGGYYVAGSCSSHVDRARFLETVREGARKARRSLQRVDGWGAPPDHPTLPVFPEGDYLKVLLFRVE